MIFICHMTEVVLKMASVQSPVKFVVVSSVYLETAMVEQSSVHS